MLVHFSLVSQEEEIIEWSPDVTLTWKDFKGRVPANPGAAATTASGISYEFSSTGTRDRMELDFKVNTFFYPHKSWYRPELCDTLILSHEQLHFDISELFARKMRTALASSTFTHNVKAEVRSIYKATLRELNDYQNHYDRQTNFSRDKEQQLLWNKKIKEALKE